MDKQIIQEFNKLYFSKKQLQRRVYNREELEEIWELISQERKDKSVKLSFKYAENGGLWFCVTDDIQNDLDFIESINKSDILGYLPKRSKNRIIEDGLLKEVVSNLRFNDIKFDNQLVIKNIKDVDREKLCYEDRVLLNLYDFLEKVGKEKVKVDDTYINKVYVDIFLEEPSSNKELLEELSDFINANSKYNDIVKASIIYYYIITFKPFNKYNNLMANILAFLHLINKSYNLVRYFSLLKTVLDEEKKYLNAIEDSKVSDGDITYFIKYYVKSIKTSINGLNREINCKYGKKIIKELLERKNIALEDRQITFINNAIASNNVVTIDVYKGKNNISYETARTDLTHLVTLGFFKISKVGKKYEYYINDIATIVESFEE